SSQRLTGQLVTKPSIVPICMMNQWLELSIGAFQITYCASAIQPNRPTSKLRTESVSDLIASPRAPLGPRSRTPIGRYAARVGASDTDGRVSADNDWPPSRDQKKKPA